MAGKRCEPYQSSVVFERRNSVADGLDSLRRRVRPDPRANLLESASRRVRHPREILIEGLRSKFAFSARSALCPHQSHVKIQIGGPVLREPRLKSSSITGLHLGKDIVSQKFFFGLGLLEREAIDPDDDGQISFLYI